MALRPGRHLYARAATALSRVPRTDAYYPTPPPGAEWADDWYVAETQPQHERQVIEVLLLHGTHPYAPEFPRPPRTRPGSVRDRRSRFVLPGYVFIKVGHGFHHWDAILRAPGVRRVLQQDGAPALVADDVVTELQRRLDAGSLRPNRPRFVSGQAVTVERGLLAPIDAVFDRELDAGTRVQILVSMMGRRLPVTLDRQDIRPLRS